MFLFRLLDFVLRVLGTVFIVVMLQIPLGEKTLEEHMLQFLRNQENMKPLRQAAHQGRQKVKKDVLIFVQKKLDNIEKARDVAQLPKDENITQETENKEDQELDQQIALLKNRHFKKLARFLFTEEFRNKFLPQLSSSLNELQKSGTSTSADEESRDIAEDAL